MKKLSKTQELITLAIKITPPPPPPRTHLNKHPRLKHLLIGITAILAIASCGGTPGTPLTSLTYPATSLNAEMGVQISDITPTLTPDGASGIYTVSPPLPEGLSLHETSGVISGTPTVLHNSTLHTVTVKGNEAYSGTVTANITVEVFAAPKAVEISKRAPADVRDSYVFFSISSLEDKADYHLAVKEKGKTAPTTAEMTEGALKRNLSTKPINVLIAQRLNAPMISYAKDTNSGKTLGTGMSSTGGLVFDSISDGSGSWTPASGTHAWIAESVLKASTQYILYGMDNGGTAVSKLLTFTTDATPLSSTNEPADQLDVIDTTLVGEDLEIAVDANEWYIFPLQTQIQQQSFVYTIELDAVDIASILPARTSVGKQIDPSEYLFLFKTVGNPPDWEDMWEKGAYVLMNTDHRSKSNAFHYSVLVNTGSIYEAPAFQNLKVQQ